MADTLFSFTLGQLLAFVLGVCSLISAIGGVAILIGKGVAKAKAPEKTQNDRITKLEERVANHDRLLGKDKDRLDSFEQGQRVTQRALLAILEWGLDSDPAKGNSKAALESSKKELLSYLIK